MAQTVHLELEIDGTVVEGESTAGGLGREGTIECASFRYGVSTPVAASGVSGKWQHRQVQITKRVDRATPALLQALTDHRVVTNAWFRFYRPTVKGEEHFYTVRLEDAYVTAVNPMSVSKESDPSVLPFGQDQLPPAGYADPGLGSPLMEAIEFAFGAITSTYEPTGTEHRGTWLQLPRPVTPDSALRRVRTAIEASRQAVAALDTALIGEWLPTESDQLRLQDALQQQGQLMDMASAIMKSAGDTQRAVLANLR